MSNDNKKIIRETSRWLRIGFMAISVLGPVVNTLSSRLRERSEKLRKETTKRSGNLLDNLVDQSSKLSQVVSEGSGRVGRNVAQRSSKATQLVADSSNDVLQELVERSEKASQELAKRGEQASKEIMKRGTKVSREVTKRSQKAAKEVQKRSRKAQLELSRRTEQLTGQNTRQAIPFWPIFSSGLIAAVVAIYLLVRRQLQRNEQNSQPEQIALNNSLNGTGKSTTSGTTYTANQPYLAAQSVETPVQESTAPALTEPVTEEVTADAPLIAEPELDDYNAVTEKIPAISIQATIEAFPATEAVEEHTDADTTKTASEASSVTPATLLGVVSTKRYYPVETPLTELVTNTGEALDVVYFVTVEEAQQQGYSPAV